MIVESPQQLSDDGDISETSDESDMETKLQLEEVMSDIAKQTKRDCGDENHDDSKDCCLLAAVKNKTIRDSKTNETPDFDTMTDCKDTAKYEPIRPHFVITNRKLRLIPAASGCCEVHDALNVVYANKLHAFINGPEGTEFKTYIINRADQYEPPT